MLEPIMNKLTRHCSLTIEMIDIAALRPYPGNARRHSRTNQADRAKTRSVVMEATADRSGRRFFAYRPEIAPVAFGMA